MCIFLNAHPRVHFQCYVEERKFHQINFDMWNKTFLISFCRDRNILGSIFALIHIFNEIICNDELFSNDFKKIIQLD